jgi:hypothetical protein
LRIAPDAAGRVRPSGDVANALSVGERAQLLQALVLDLPDPLARDVERATDLVERARLLAVEPVPEPSTTRSRSESAEDGPRASR